MGTVVVGAIVVVIAGLAVRSIVIDKKSGKGFRKSSYNRLPAPFRRQHENDKKNR